MEKKKIRIFISSPGDVQQERNIARNVINELNEIYSQYVKLETLMWEDFPLSADSTFQEGINYFLNENVIDIAVFILWSRLGTPLCNKFKKLDGSYYKSGTEYEFDMMMQLFKEKGWPRILTYVRNSEIKPNVTNLKELEDILRQKENVDAFIQEYFHDDNSNSNYAYLQFGDNSSFEQKFRTHLTNAIKNIIGDIGEIREWEGNPYVGLNSFEYEQSSIFFGRKQLVYETASKLIDFNDVEKKKSLIVLGESGSGKSSFIKAGLLPFLCKDKSGSYIIVNPSMYGGNFYQGLIDILIERFTFLKGNPFVDELRVKIDENTNFKHLSFAFSQNKYNDVILYIDQFEELFIDTQISEEERLHVLLLLSGIVSTMRLSVFISMRSDYYYCFSQYKSMAQLKNDCVFVDIPVVGYSEISEIVEVPARKACLKWELDNNANALNKRIVRDAMMIKDLPLIEFALSELYKMRDDNECLTFDAYNKIGGLKGAITNYANTFYNELDEKEKNVMADLLGFVVTESKNRNVYVRKTSLIKDAAKTELHKIVIDKMVNAHLFVSGKDNDGNATFTITHEILLKSWEVVVEWIDKENEFITTSRHYEQLAQHWITKNKSDKYLVSGRSRLLEAEYFHFKNKDRITNELKSFLEASFRKDLKTGLVWRCILLGIFLLSMLAFVFLKILNIEIGAEIIDDIRLRDPVYWLVQISYLILLLNSIILRVKGLPEYCTNKLTVFTWGAATILLAVSSVIDSEDVWTSVFCLIIYALPVGVYCLIELKELIRRNKWKKQYVPYKLTDEFVSQSKKIIITIIVVFFVIIIIGSYMVELIDKQEEMEERARYTDTLFDGLETSWIKGGNQFTYDDYNTVFNMRKDYLESYFKNELLDTLPDIRESEYARTLFNLGQCNDATAYLYPEYYWADLLFYIHCKYTSGRYDEARFALELYMTEERKELRYDEFGAYTTEDLVWIAEKLGRFDYAEQIDKILLDTIFDEMGNNPTYFINRAHIYMYKDDIDRAVNTYKEGIGLWGPDYREDIKHSIETDFHTMSRFGVMPDQKMQDMSIKLGIDFTPAYISEIDTILNSKMYEYLHGNWFCTDQYCIILNVDERGLFTYEVYMDSTISTLMNRTLSEVRMCEGVGEIYWDEFYLNTDQNSYGKIIDISADYFDLEIIENGNPEDEGKIRRYERIKNE